jgi:hypothetical protein
VLGRFARRHRPQPAELPHLRLTRPRRIASGTSSGDRRREAETLPTDEDLRRRAAWWKCSPSTSARAGSRATCSRAGTGCLLRGVHPHRRLDVQPARQVAEGDIGIPWRRPIASPIHCSAPCLAPDQTASHQDPLHDHVVNKKAEIIRAVPAAGREHAARSPTTACAARTTST